MTPTGVTVVCPMQGVCNWHATLPTAAEAKEAERKHWREFHAEEPA
jgi:hypothetical protein